MFKTSKEESEVVQTKEAESTLRIYFKGGTVVTIENVTDWSWESQNNALKKFDIKFNTVPGKELLRYFCVSEIVAVTEITKQPEK